jgi:predicted acetyltransferase
VCEYRTAQEQDFVPLKRMLELYQYEISDMYDQDLDALGEYGYDLTRHREAKRSFAHVVLVDGRYAGFALVAPGAVTQKDGYWMEQFFILKKYRRSGLGAEFAQSVFHSHPGAWEVGQMPSNLPAQAFWRKVIASITAGRFTEVQVTEGWWQGVVQRFSYETAA